MSIPEDKLKVIHEILGVEVTEDKLEQLVEALRTTMSRRNKIGKFHALSGAFSMGIAKKKNDPQYKQMLRLRKGYRILKTRLLQKYRSKGVMAARVASMHH